MSKQLIADFAEHLKATGKSASTVTAYSKDLEQLLEHTEDNLHRLSAEQVKDAIDRLQEKHDFAAKTVSRKINSFRTFYNYLQESGHIDYNPAEKVDHPKIHAKPPRVLSPMEFFALREVSRNNPRLYAMIETMLQTGMRIGEISRLKIKHARLDEDGHIHIEPYSTIDERRIPLNNKLREVLENYLEGMEYDHHDHPVFPTRDGNPIIIRNIRSSIDRAMVKAEIEDACVNDLRNTFIVQQLKSGVPIDVVAEVVGHKSKTTTQKYIDVLEEDYQPRGESKIVEV